uniref:Putative cutinase n=1 Tax=Phytophthora capsici TaxID=4784 RepID=CUTI_PHYCP|nr:RecName: Full=Putative cutinase; AltName: Full=Cutin hydrolase [Phytophthora capsici]CAA61622.1 cutinase [Phytophthora capsici]
MALQSLPCRHGSPTIRLTADTPIVPDSERLPLKRDEPGSRSMRSTFIPSSQCSNLSSATASSSRRRSCRRYQHGEAVASSSTRWRTKWNLFIICLLLLCLPGLAVRYMHDMFSPCISGVANSQHSSSQSPRSHCRSLVPSFIAIYSASVVLCALISCFLDPYETTLPLTNVTNCLTLFRSSGSLRSEHRCSTSDSRRSRQQLSITSRGSA